MGIHLEKVDVLEIVREALKTRFPDEFVFYIPLPPYELSSNDRKHWKVKANFIQSYREACGFACARAMKECDVPGFKLAVIHAKYIFVKGDPQLAMRRTVYKGGKPVNQRMFYQPNDEDNARAALKPAQDGMMDAGLAVRDSKRFVHHGMTAIERWGLNEAIAHGIPASCVEVIVQGVYQ